MFVSMQECHHRVDYLRDRSQLSCVVNPIYQNRPSGLKIVLELLCRGAQHEDIRHDWSAFVCFTEFHVVDDFTVIVLKHRFYAQDFQ